jgi:alkylation response protein AidB-like acyl-CoA dehydrogenase
MNLLPNSEQQQIIDSVADFMNEKLPVARYRTAPAKQVALGDDELGQIVDLGWLCLGLDEQHGGLGNTVAEEMLMFREIGRQVGPIDVLATVLAIRVAAASGDAELLEQLLAGQERVAIALSRAQGTTSGSCVSGPAYLAGPAGASYALMFDDKGASLFKTAGLASTELPCLESQMSLRAADLVEHPALFVPASVEPLADRARILIAAMQVGTAEAARDMAVEYAKVREQFGRPIGSFQALKHVCADMAVRCEESASQLTYATLHLRDASGEGGNQVAMAAFLASRAALENTAANIQVHGGIGMTSELDAHTYLKRAHVLEQLAGGARHQLELTMADTLD